MLEVWKPIRGFEKLYEVSSHGNVRSVRSGKLISSHDNGLGWQIVELYDTANCKEGTGYSKRGAKRFKLHRLVATHFLHNVSNFRFVIHVDGNRNNCKASNLRWTKTHWGLN